MMRFRHTLFFVAMLCVGPASRLMAVDVAAGVSSVDEGDDRLRPALIGHIGGEHVYSRFLYYGRKFATVSERTALLSVNYRWPLFKGSWYGGIGMCELAETTRIKDPTDQEPEINETNYNTGMSLGLFWSPPIRPMTITLGWESHLFLAGEAGIFLSTGRKESLSFALGFRL